MTHKNRMKKKRLGIHAWKSQVLPSKEGGKGRREDEGDGAEKAGEERPMAGVLETWEMTVKKNQNAFERSSGHGMKDTGCG